MPAPMIKSFAEKSGKSEKEVETLYKKAEEVMSKQYPDISKDGDSDKYYSLHTAILKKMVGLKENGLIGFKRFLEEKYN